jgi:hypothetical protein
MRGWWWGFEDWCAVQSFDKLRTNGVERQAQDERIKKVVEV